MSQPVLGNPSTSLCKACRRDTLPGPTSEHLPHPKFRREREHFQSRALCPTYMLLTPTPRAFCSPSSTLRSPSSPIQEEDEEKLSEMSDGQPHALRSGSPAPTEVSRLCGPSGAELPSAVPRRRHRSHIALSLPLPPQATAAEDVADSLSPDDGEFRAPRRRTYATTTRPRVSVHSSRLGFSGLDSVVNILCLILSPLSPHPPGLCRGQAALWRRDPAGQHQ